MLGIRQKLMMVYSVVVVLVTVIGGLTINQIHHLKQSLDSILKQNYRSVLAVQKMKESMEHLNSSILQSFIPGVSIAENELLRSKEQFLNALEVEQANTTLPTEVARAKKIADSFKKYLSTLPHVMDSSVNVEERYLSYAAENTPLFTEIQQTAQEILEVGQKNVRLTSDATKQEAVKARHYMLAVIFLCVLAALLFSIILHRWILEPIHRLTEYANEIRKGRLDLVLDVRSNDEIGQLSETFNAMVEGLRQMDRHNRIHLMQSQQATEEVLRVLPLAIAVIDLEGRIEAGTEMAIQQFGLKPGELVQELPLEWLFPFLKKAAESGVDAKRIPVAPQIIKHFINNQEYFFEASLIPTRSKKKAHTLTGFVLFLNDVTQVHEQQELKQGVISTVSNQLKTPLTSLRMSIHLLLNEGVGEVNEKQTELLVAAREESERLADILENLLDINKIESGKAAMAFKPLAPRTIARDAVEPFLMDMKDKGITLHNTIEEDLPLILADPNRIHHVLANLLSNAIRFTSPGGTITIGALSNTHFVVMYVRDTGPGIPTEYKSKIFEPFYQIPDQQESAGAGLGLAIAKEIVEAHRGKMGVRSKLGEGAAFWFALPRSDQPLDQVIEFQPKDGSVP